MSGADRGAFAALQYYIRFAAAAVVCEIFVMRKLVCSIDRRRLGGTYSWMLPWEPFRRCVAGG